MRTGAITLDDGMMADLYRLHERTLRWYLCRAADIDPHLAEDIVQETFLRAWRSPNLAFDEPESCRAWLITVARNVLVDTLRRRGRRPRETSDDVLADMPVRCASERLATALILHEAMSMLTPRQREVIGQVFVMDRTHPQAAEALGIPLGTVKSRVNGALCALRRHLTAPDLQLAS